MEELLELMRVQRHNFANHLQVISGLLQLKKYDRAFEYIKGVGDELNRAGYVARLEVQPLVKAILVAELAAGKKGIHIEYQIDNNMADYKGSVEALVSIVQEMLSKAIGFLEEKFGAERVIKLGIHEQDGGFLIDLSLPLDADKGSGKETSYFDEVVEKARAQGWTLDIQQEEGFLIILTI